MKNIQLDSDGKLKHFLSIEGLSADILNRILDTAQSLHEVAGRAVKNVPLLRGKTIVNLFFEPSTRTRTTFEIAAKRLSADVINLDIASSSTTKGESLIDTLQTLEAMHSDMFVIRHQHSGAAHFFAQHAAPGISILNAGDGWHAHPTQAMLDMYTIKSYKPEFHGLKVAIVGDILHSRVARSQIHALNILGVGEVRVIAPQTLLPEDMHSMGTHVFNDMESGLEACDVIIMLRLQNERMQGDHLPGGNEYFNTFGLTEKRLKLAKPDCIVMHPGPMNRGVEIESAVADGPQSVILEQVSHGIAVRMAVMAMVLGHQSESKS